MTFGWIYNRALFLAADSAASLTTYMQMPGTATAPLSARVSTNGASTVGGAIDIVPIHDELVNRRAGSDGSTSYEEIATILRRLAVDERIRGIVLDIDSPGGEATGAVELGQLVQQVSARKPVVAVANGRALSGAYAIAAGASRIIMPAAAMVGAIGVVLLHLDRSAEMRRRSLNWTLIHAGARKVDGTPLANLTPDAHRNLQAIVDGLYTLFVDAVAAHRGMSPEAVRSTEGGIVLGEEALKLGVADQLGTMSDAIEWITRIGSLAARPTAPAAQPLPATTASSPGPTQKGRSPSVRSSNRPAQRELACISARRPHTRIILDLLSRR